MSRNQLPTRRRGVTMDITHIGAHGEHAMVATFGPADGGPVRECFGEAFRSGTDMRALIADGCILASIALQYGAPIDELDRALGRAEIQGRMRPASAIGTIIRAGAELEANEYADGLKPEPQKIGAKDVKRKRHEVKPAGDQGNTGGVDYPDQRGADAVDGDRFERRRDHHSDSGENRVAARDDQDGSGQPSQAARMVLPVKSEMPDIPSFLLRFRESSE